MYHVSAAQGVDERMINVHYYYDRRIARTWITSADRPHPHPVHPDSVFCFCFNNTGNGQPGRAGASSQ